MNGNKKNRNIGAAILFITFGLLFFVLVVRFLTIQFTGEAEGRVLAAKAAQLYLRQDVIKSKRGTIFDQKGEVIAEDSASYTLVAILSDTMTIDEEYPRHVVNPRETASKLAMYIDMSEQEIYDLLTREGRFQVEFGQSGRDLPHNVKKQIEELKLPGITFVKDSKRFYPNGIFSSHLIGYAQKEEAEDKTSEIIGIMGLEKSYDDILKGLDGSMSYEGDIWNYILPNSQKQIIEPENGHDIYLTIDKKIQTFLEDALSKVAKEYSPKRIMAIIADPKTGKIIGMGQRPTFHPATRVGIDESWHNEIIETSFEPGSTMKIFSLAAAIEEKVFNPTDKFPSGKYFVGSTPVSDHNYGKGWGPITYLEGVQRSSNVGFAYLLEKMGTDKWRNYMDEFKFGVKTGIDLPSEASGKILYNWPIEKVTSVFGQGTTVTAMQMIQAMTAVANDGQMMEPYVVEKIVNPNDGTEQVTNPKIAGQPISKETAKELRDILETVITAENGTGGRYAIEGYKVAGKTGTSQIPNPKGGGYLEGRNDYIFSFLGMAPADDPQLIMYVAIEQPNLGELENGAVPVSMIFNPVMKNSLQYLNIEPEEIPQSRITSLPDFSKMKVQEAAIELENHGLVPVIIGKGDVILGQSPLAGVPIIEGEKIILRTNGDLTVPDMSGWSKRDVLKAAQLAGLKINIVGNGYASKQNVKPNSPVQEGDHIVVNFETPLQKLEREMMIETEGEGEMDPPLN